MTLSSPSTEQLSLIGKKGILVKILEEGERPILHSKSDLINRLKDGILPNRLTAVKKESQIICK